MAACNIPGNNDGDASLTTVSSPKVPPCFKGATLEFPIDVDLYISCYEERDGWLTDFWAGGDMNSDDWALLEKSEAFWARKKAERAATDEKAPVNTVKVEEGVSQTRAELPVQNTRRQSSRLMSQQPAPAADPERVAVNSRRRRHKRQSQVPFVCSNCGAASYGKQAVRLGRGRPGKFSLATSLPIKLGVRLGPGRPRRVLPASNPTRSQPLQCARVGVANQGNGLSRTVVLALRAEGETALTAPICGQSRRPPRKHGARASSKAVKELVNPASKRSRAWPTRCAAAVRAKPETDLRVPICKRGRGRPRKENDRAVSSAGLHGASGGAMEGAKAVKKGLKRGPGRPKKGASMVILKGEANLNETNYRGAHVTHSSTYKRSRRNQDKIQSNVHQVPATCGPVGGLKRGRGRPKKIVPMIVPKEEPVIDSRLKTGVVIGTRDGEAPAAYNGSVLEIEGLSGVKKGVKRSRIWYEGCSSPADGTPMK